ncbi:MAG TPA: hypothetical protein VET30_05670 [Pseudoxanthomonas sp.]|nr:hypothetical protein [Pseudoxanthomonas sp.]
MIEPSEQVREKLHALPGIPLPDTLWQRVDAGRRQQIRRRKLGVGVATLALVAVMATPLLAPLFVRNETAQAGSVAAHLPGRDTREKIHAEVRALDHALQAAYDRGASDAEIAPMWVARDALLSSIAFNTPTPLNKRI